MKMNWMTIAASVLFALALAAPATAQVAKKMEKPHSAAEVKEDIANHRAMADAHLSAAKCLEAGRPVKLTSAVVPSRAQARM